MQHKNHSVDLCVVGGGMAGLCAAVAAARHGIKVALMQDRPVLGGNASSEIRIWITGAMAGAKNVREAGLLEEIIMENYYRNTNLSFSIWDSVLYGIVRGEPNITLLLDCTCQKAEMDDDTIRRVTGWQLTTETYHTVEAKYFADCSGDSILAPLTGAEFMLGREAKRDFGERIPPDEPDNKTMGLSCVFQIRETDSPKKFIPPAWAYKYPTDDMLKERPHDNVTNYWWIELGGDKDSIHDTEDLRDELLKIAFGVWDHMKNYGDHGVENWEMDWIGFLPGKRESRRYVGDYVITQNDVEAEGRFDDIIAYGGWTMDDHFPEGFYYDGGHPTIYHPAPSPWGIPYRCLYSKNIKNLLFAGRNISVTHAALSSSRVMGTCSLLGQALGTAVAIAVKDGVPLRGVDTAKLQQQLMEDDCWIPWHTRELPPLTKKARVNAEIVRNGIDRETDEGYNGFVGSAGDCITFTYDDYEDISQVRLVFDSNLNRKSNNMPCNFPLYQPEYKTPVTLIKEFDIVADTPDGERVVYSETNNYQRLVYCDVNVRAKAIRLVPKKTWGDDKFRVFSMDVL